MIKFTVQMFGLPPEITTLRAVEIEVNEGAGMGEVIAAIRQKTTALDGPVFRPGEDRLADLYKFNVNGRFYFDGMDFKLQPGDRIALLVPATGG